EQLDEMEPTYPLHVRICDGCLLVQLVAYVGGEDIFRDYAYFSSYSPSWVEHARAHAGAMTDRFRLDRSSFVVEVASNDGYLLRHFVEAGIPSLGIDPAVNVAEAAAEVGVETLVDFFDGELAAKVVADRGHADLIAANNVLAQVPDLNSFVEGIRILL